MSGVDVAVVGSVNLDLTVPVGRVPRPGETVLGADARRGPGGKGANQAVACARLGLRTTMIGCVGEDADGGMLAERLRAEGVDVRHLVPVPAPTGLAMIILEEGDGESTIVVSPGANGRLDAGRVRAAEGTITGARAVLAQLEIPIPAVAEAVRLATGTVVLNPAPARPLPRELLSRVDVLVPNRHELAVLCQAPTPESPDEVADLARSLLPGGPRAVVVTLGADGAMVVTADGVARVPAVPVRAVDATAAGDSFCAGLVAGLLAGEPLAEAAARCCRAAAVTVSRPGAIDALPTAADLAAPPAPGPAASPA